MADFDDFIASKEAELGGAESAPEAPAAEAAAAPAAEAPAAEADLDLDAPIEGDKFDRAYVERIRKEAAKHRTELKAFKDAFEGYEDGDREALMTLARQLKSDPRAAAQEMAAAAEAILGHYKEETAEADTDEDAGSEFMTRAEYDRIREEEAVRAEQISIESEARDLGYTVNLNNTKYRMLLLTAQSLPSGSISEAHAKLEAERQADIDAYVASKTADAQGAVVPPATGGAPTPSQPFEPTFANARLRLEEFIRNQ
jgi:hypothetical protein